MENKENVKIISKGSAFLRISLNEERECNFYSLKVLGRKKKSINHHILLVDVSGSMYSEIPVLKDTVKSTLEALCIDQNNYVSLIAYSGHNESYRIINGVKCDKTSYSMANVYENLENELYSRGVTVMSEPLNDAINIERKLTNICDTHHIALFTDGCLIPLKWTPLEEEKKCYEVAEICKDNNIFLNAIGFGKYYDRDFLKSIVSIPKNGKFIHIDSVENYGKEVLEMTRKIKEGQLIQADIKNRNYFLLDSAKRIIEESESLSLNRSRENILVVFDEELKFEDKVISKRKVHASENLVNNFMYSLSLNHINNEDYESAEITLAQTGDTYLFNKLNNCYSFLERGEIQGLVSKASENEIYRYIEGKNIIKIKSKEEEDICLLEILKEIIADEKSKLLWDFKYQYKRIGMKSIIEKDRYQFKYDKTGYGEVIDISIGSKKLNVGLKVEIKGEVIDTISKLKLDSKIYRDFNLIVNGNINTTELSCILSRSLKMKLKKEGILKKTIKWNGISICILDITKLKTTNKRILNSLKETEIAKYLYNIEVLACRAWALNKHIKNLFINNPSEALNLSSLPQEEIEARKAFRVNESGVFNEIKSSNSESKEPFEVYPATVLEWKLDKFPKAKTQAKIFVDYESLITGDLGESYYGLIKELSIVKKEKKYLQSLVNLVRISSGLIRKSAILWDEEYSKAKREFNKELNMNMIINDSVRISTKTINGISIREDYYTVLTKCD